MFSCLLLTFHGPPLDYNLSWTFFVHDTPCATYATFYSHSVEKLQILSHQKKIFREINSLVPYLVIGKPLHSRNFS